MAETTKKAESENKKLSVWQKLMLIQKAVKTFQVSEDSDKTSPTGKPEYKYTPGWAIIEAIRKQMDELGLMLIPQIVGNTSTLIEYPVYKDFHGKAMSFNKKEMFIELIIDYFWVDTATGEKEGPFRFIGYGANGTDKSGASAISTAKRYFLKEFFNFTTHETIDELDAHDSGFVPGLPASSQPMNLSAQRSAEAVSAFPAAGAPAPEPVMQQAPAYQPQPAMPPLAPQPMPQQAPYPQPVAAGGYPAPAAPQPAFNGEFNENDPLIQEAASQLAVFEKGTASHQRCLNQQIGRLSAARYQCTTAEFIGKLVETGQAKREGRLPVYA